MKIDIAYLVANRESSPLLSAVVMFTSHLKFRWAIGLAIASAVLMTIFWYLNPAHGPVSQLALPIASLMGAIIAISLRQLIPQSESKGRDSVMLERKIEKQTKELRQTKQAAIFGLAKLAESRDNDTGEHLERIGEYVRILATELATTNPNINERFISDLSLASSLHDVGKVGIPDSILLKPGRLTPEQREVMKLHTNIGGECLDAILERGGKNRFMKFASDIAYSHHERWDGDGYPRQLAGEAIPLVARIVSVADVYDALTSKRPYKKAMGHIESKAVILLGSGSQFDPEVVAAFARHEKEFELISRKQQTLSDEDSKSDIQRRQELATS